MPEKTPAVEACRHAVEGVIGHVHRVTIDERFAVCRVNCAHWVENYAAVPERADSRLEILTWRSGSPQADEPRRLAAAHAA